MSTRISQHFKQTVAVAQTTPTLESLGGILAAGVAFIALSVAIRSVATGIQQLFNGEIFAEPKHARAAVAGSQQVLSKTFLNKEWMEKQTPTNKIIAMPTVSGPLAVGSKVPTDIPVAVAKHLAAVRSFYANNGPKLKAYADKTKATFDKMVTIKDEDAAIDYGEVQLRGIKTPDQSMRLTLPEGLLGNPTFDKSEEDGTVTIDYVGNKAALPCGPFSKDDLVGIAESLSQVMDAAAELLPYQAIRLYDYEDDLFAKNDDLWQAMIGTGLDDHYSHNFHESWSHAYRAHFEQLKKISVALQTILQNGIKG